MCWLAFSGMALMTIQRSFLDIGRGDLLVAGCAVAYAFHILVLGRFAGSANFGVLTVVQIAHRGRAQRAELSGGRSRCISMERRLVAGAAVTSLLATALAFAVQTWAQRYSSPTRTALIFSMEPVFAWATSYVVAGEVLSKRAAFGGCLILAGILMVELKPAALVPGFWFLVSGYGESPGRENQKPGTRNQEPETRNGYYMIRSGSVERQKVYDAVV